MLYGSTPPAGRPYRDGFLTQRNTFQKYFTQQELKDFIESALNTDAIPAAPGIMFVFKDKELEQSYLYNRQRNKHTHELLGFRHARQQKILIPKQPRESRTAQLLRENKELIDSLWSSIIELGRAPEQDEFGDPASVISVFGSWRKAIAFAMNQNEVSEIESSAKQRTDDLIVYLALQLFSKRKPYRHLDTRLQRDIKAFFGDFQKALSVTQSHLARIADPAALHEACTKAVEMGLGYLSEEDHLQLHSSLVEQLPALLRIYVGCGSILYGDIYDVDLVKIHTRSGKVTFMKFDDFVGSPLPMMQERIKISLKKQQIDFFKYGEEFESPPLYLKSRYINEDFPKYAEQAEFDEAISKLGILDDKSYGPSAEDLAQLLTRRRLRIADFTLAGEITIPDLDSPCGRYFKYRDLIECGETWESIRIDNAPKNPETFNALNALCVNLLDPIIDYFGMIKLTYGFCSPQLAKKIKGRIAPALDQHSSYEVKKSGSIICERKGAAVDFIIEDEDMAEVLLWIAQNLNFDRIYFYKSNQPVHISYSPACTKNIVIMNEAKKTLRLVPQSMSLERFLKAKNTDQPFDNGKERRN
jgi:DNA phosphorothioation-associated putative methyltransferase